MSWLDFFRRKTVYINKIIYKEKPKFIKQISTKIISGLEAKQIVKDATGNITFNKADALYKLIDIEHFKKFLTQNNISNREYIINDHDCDDFSFELMGEVSTWDSHLAFGVIWGITTTGGAHAWNWFIGTDKKIWFVEPQNNKIFLPTTEKPWWIAM